MCQTRFQGAVPKRQVPTHDGISETSLQPTGYCPGRSRPRGRRSWGPPPHLLPQSLPFLSQTLLPYRLPMEKETFSLNYNRRSGAEERGVLAECLQVHGGPAVTFHSDQHQLYYLRKYVRHIVESLSFSKDVLEQQGLSYKEYNFKHLYDPSDIIQKPKSEKPIVVNLKHSARSHPQKQPLLPKKNSGLFPKLRKEDSLWGSKLETLPRRFLPPVPSCKTPGMQASPSKPCEKVSGSLRRKQKKWISEKNTLESQMMTWEMEKTRLEKQNRTTLQRTANQQKPRSGSVQRHPVDGEKQKCNAIRDELSSNRDVKMSDNIQGKENDMGIISQTQAEKTPRTVLPISSRYGGRVLFPSVSLSTVNPADKNDTADATERTSLNSESSAQRYLISRVGKHTYTPKNTFERELYFGKVHIIWPKFISKVRMKDFFILENHDQYCKHLQQPFPRQPECWGCKSQRRTVAWRPKKGAFRWIALPTLTPYFVQNDEESPPTKAKEVQKEFKEPNKEVSWETQVLRATLEQWKDAWDLREWIVLFKSTWSIMNSNTAVTESARKCSVTQDVFAELGPLLSEALRDPNAHVRMASALCHYALGDRSEEARAVMKDALEHGKRALWKLPCGVYIPSGSSVRSYLTF
uniref:HEAT repeat-containing protein 4 n=1 Tax=Nothoprocta perdicaria TaxID=30464 RepID=A0A8C6YQG1_NOTPE